jgi:hypothetical protein
MPCLPESGGCERPFTDAFVGHLNRAESASFVHRACLDVAQREIPQPEALYEDLNQKLPLVIERKSISWPLDYAYRHSNDHVVADVFTHELKGLPSDGLYELRLPLLIEGKRPHLKSLALAAAQRIRSNWPRIASGWMMEERVDDKWWWQFRKVHDSEREDNVAADGIMVEWEGPGGDFLLRNYIDPVNPSEEFVDALKKIYSSCAAKFTSYPGARRVLLIDPHGDLRSKDSDWWRSIWISFQPPAQIGEIWSGVFDLIHEGLEDWVFERLY